MVENTAELHNLASGCAASGDGLAAKICRDAIAEIERLRAIVDLLPQQDGKPVIPHVNPEDGTADRLGVVFRYSRNAAEAKGGG